VAAAAAESRVMLTACESIPAPAFMMDAMLESPC
jgi:hypothetical protein